MSRIRISRRRTEADPRRRNEWPAVVYFWIFGLALLSYLLTRIGLDGYPHPYHWFAAVAGGMLGLGVGWLWYRWRGDVF
jgi:hypothetical protein